MKTTMKQALRIRLHNLVNTENLHKALCFAAFVCILSASLSVPQSYAWFHAESGADMAVFTARIDYEMTAAAIQDPDSQENLTMLPNRDLFESIRLVNKSTIDTKLRMQIRYTVWTGSTVLPADWGQTVGGVYLSPGALGVATVGAAYYMGSASEPAIAAIEDQCLRTSLRTDLYEYGYADAADVVDPDYPTDAAFKWWYYKTTVPALGYTFSTSGSGISGGAVIGMHLLDEDGVEVPLFATQAGIENRPLFRYDGPKTTDIFADKPVRIEIVFQAKQPRYVDWATIGALILGESP
jgi:hypothetical protein